jgi:hypothetical protein
MRQKTVSGTRQGRLSSNTVEKGSDSLSFHRVGLLSPTGCGQPERNIGGLRICGNFRRSVGGRWPVCLFGIILIVLAFRLRSFRQLEA